MSTVLTFVAGQVVSRSNVGAQSTFVVTFKLLGFPEIYMCKLMGFTLHAFDFTCNKMVLIDLCLSWKRFNASNVFQPYSSSLSCVHTSKDGVVFAILSSGIKYILDFLFKHWLEQLITCIAFLLFFL